MRRSPFRVGWSVFARKSSSAAESGGHDVWVWCCRYDLGDGSTLDGRGDCFSVVAVHSRYVTILHPAESISGLQYACARTSFRECGDLSYVCGEYVSHFIQVFRPLKRTIVSVISAVVILCWYLTEYFISCFFTLHSKTYTRHIPGRCIRSANQNVARYTYIKQRLHGT